MSKCWKTNYRKIEKKNDNDMDADVAQLERNNNKCYALIFRYIYRQEFDYYGANWWVCHATSTTKIILEFVMCVCF